MTSVFDPEAFLNSTTDQPSETKFTPVPGGDYRALIDDIKLRVAKESTILDVTWQLLEVPQDVLEVLGRDKALVRQSLFLDIENGVLATGANRNVQLGRVREAVGQNASGQVWSPRMLKGAGPAQLRLEVKPRKDDASIMENVITRVAKLA